MSAETVTISSLGAKGDGIAHGSDGPVFVPFSLPGETVSIARVKNEGGFSRPASISGPMASAASAAAVRSSIWPSPPTMPSSGRC